MVARGNRPKATGGVAQWPRVTDLAPGVYFTALCHRCERMCAVPLPSGVARGSRTWTQLPPPVLLRELRRSGVEIGPLLAFCIQHARCGDGAEPAIVTVSSGATS